MLPSVIILLDYEKINGIIEEVEICFLPNFNTLNAVVAVAEENNLLLLEKI